MAKGTVTMRRPGMSQWGGLLIASALGLWFTYGTVSPTLAAEFIGTVQFAGTVSATVPEVALEDIEVSVRPITEATEGGEKCEILSATSDNASVSGIYPDTGTVSAQIKIRRGGGPANPEGECVVVVQARGTDGVSISARGSQIVFVTATEINTNAALDVDIEARQSKAVAALDKECFKWVKKQLAKRSRCNFLLLKKGVEKADRCKDAGPEPADCDPGDHVETILALGHGMNDQQTDPGSAENVDFTALKDQVICQKRFGKAAFKFAKKRLRLVRRKCVDANLDSGTCRDDQSKDSKRMLDQIDKCVVDQAVDGGTGRIVPDVDPPCDFCIVGGVIDRKCMKSCFQLVVDELTDGIIGDLPVCGDGILQPPEFCDDGNLIDGDCCSSSCAAENLGDQTCGAGECEVTVPVCQSGLPLACVPDLPGTEGPSGDPTCSDGLDNDCDGATDGADTDCL